MLIWADRFLERKPPENHPLEWEDFLGGVQLSTSHLLPNKPQFSVITLHGRSSAFGASIVEGNLNKILALEAKWTGGPLLKHPPAQKSSHSKSSHNPSS